MMGGSQSTRKITVDNENTIHFSQEALERIQSQLSNKSGQKPQPQPQQQPPRAPHNAGPADAGYYPPSHYYDSHRKMNEYAAEEAYWSQRISNLKRAHDKINAVSQVEYQRTLQQANELLKQTQEDKIIGKKVPCEDERKLVLQCYEANPNRSLLCAKVVNSFNECVSANRMTRAAAITS